MATVYDHICLVSTVKNTSGKAMFFGFLPPHGKKLAVDEEINVFGNILHAIQHGDRFGNRHKNGLLDSLDSGLLTLLSTPAPIVVDATTAASKVVGVDNGNLNLSDPCWETSLSEV